MWKLKREVSFCFEPVFQSIKMSSKITPFYVSFYWHPQLCEWHCKPPQWSGKHLILITCFYSGSTTFSLSDVLVKMSNTETFRISHRQIPSSRSSPQAAGGGCSSHLAPAAARGTALWEVPSKESRRDDKKVPLYIRGHSAPNSSLQVQPVWFDRYWDSPSRIITRRCHSQSIIEWFRLETTSKIIRFNHSPALPWPH